jgi:hypothetical protein
MHAAVLTFDARNGVLSGTIDPKQKPFHLHGESGGSRGHGKATPEQARAFRHGQSTTLMSQLATTKELKDAHGHYVLRGGTLPEGTYICHYEKHHHGFLGPVVRLQQTASALVINSLFASMPIHHSRGKFYIHGPGPKGSDGCIVLNHTPERDRLFAAIREHRVVLKVVHVRGYMLPAENFTGLKS